MDFEPTYTVRVLRLDAMLAEVHVVFAGVPEGADVRGRVLGPRCPGMSTVEVAYPFQPLPGETGVRVLLPEPTFWTAERPYVYTGPADFFRDGEKLGSITVTFGLKRSG